MAQRLPVVASFRDVAREIVYPPYSIYRGFARRRTQREYGLRSIASAADGNLAILNIIGARRPAAVGKIGSLELQAINAYVSGEGRYRRYRSISRKLHQFAGIFPPTGTGIDEFCRIYIDALGSIDVLAVWYNAGEPRIADRFCGGARLAELTALEPYFHMPPWSQGLEGKTVLIISPFTDSIGRQLRRRLQIWPNNPLLLPSFNVALLNAPLSDGLVPSQWASWSAALAILQKRMAQIPFDVAIIGAGAFSVPLCAHAKRLGRVGIHTGGPTQILFGIRGGRWDKHPQISKFFNDAWIRPSADETPSNARSVERGCYW
jgi:hypothetical protein